MKNRKSDPLKRLLKRTALDKPTLDFTMSVMREIEAEAKGETIINPELKILVRRQAMDIPSVGFTQKIINRVRVNDFENFNEPIISRKAWSVLVATVLLIAIFVGFSDEGAISHQGLVPHFIKIGNIFSTIFMKAYALPTLYLTTFMALGGLLIMDYILRRMKLMKKNPNLPERMS